MRTRIFLLLIVMISIITISYGSSVLQNGVVIGEDVNFRAEPEIGGKNQIIIYAKSLIGTKYVYGGQSNQGFDCSGFTMCVFAKFGIALPHQADLQIRRGEEVPDKSDLIPGDLVFFKTEGSLKVNHVGIFLGDGRFIHASSGYGSVRISPLDNGYYYQCYVGGRRIIKDNENVSG